MSVLSTAAQKQVEDSLVKEGVLSKEQLSDLKEQAEKENTPLLSFLTTSGLVPDETLTKTIAHVAKVPYVNLTSSRIPVEVLDLLPQEVAERYMAVPLGEMQNRLVVAMLDADNVQAVDFLSNKIGRPLKVYAASESGIRNVLHQYQASISKQALGDISGMETPALPDATQMEGRTGTKTATDSKNIKTIVQDSPISKALSTILEYAAKNGASDVHVEPLQDALKIRCRIDGILREILRLPKSTEPPLVSRIKILANMKIDEHRIPQDGEFSISAAGKEIDLRIAISPVVWGEQVVIRLLDKTGTSLKIEDMGYTGRALRTIREGIKGTSGMVLTSGPTGSGKSTSLYALLQEVKSDAINIVTLEDPVEYKMDGINQIQVNAEVGLTFANGLRSILRQDPDVVMVGEIRDKETAELAVQAALTGHLVFSTLHTNSAAGILPRLLDMNIEPFLIASTVRTVIGQRLVRRIGAASETYESDKVETEAIKKTVGHLLPKTAEEMPKFAEDLGYESLPLAGQNAYTLTKGKDSPEAPGGYKGRMGIYEVFNITPEIQQLILKRATSAEIQKAAQGQGMITMREDGYLKALAGRTTITEVNRVAAADSA
jgi:type IV pilus assembly protein PilB